MDYFKYTFNEDEWCIYLIDDYDHDTSDADAAAETKFEQKELYFRNKDLTLSTVLHELWHVYIGYCYLSDATGLDQHSIEEISAALFADKCERILVKAKDIYDKLKQLKQEESASEQSK
jgi:hypothetical protein